MSWQLEPGRQSPPKQPRPGQQSVAAEQTCEVVAQLRSIVGVASHLPLVHWPLQQSLGPLHAVVASPHAGLALHLPPTQLFPPQQSSAVAQRFPCLPHQPRHAVFEELAPPEQNGDDTQHEPPPAPHASPAQLAPAAGLQNPPLHASPPQQSLVAVQLHPSLPQTLRQILPG